MLERFSDSNLNLLYCFQENKNFFGNILKETKCNCIFCETVAFDDIPTILKRMSTEIPILMKKLENIKQTHKELSQQDEIYFKRLQPSLNKMTSDIETFCKNEYLSHYDNKNI